MEVGDWITLGAVIVALSIGVASILHTRSIQKKERKDRLLNEIIEWAVELSTCRLSIPAPMMFEDIIAGIETATVERMVERATITTFTNIRLRYRIADRKSNYLKDVALRLPGNLDDKIRKVSKQLHEVISALHEYIKEPNNRNKEEKLAKAEAELLKQADRLVDEAVKLKTKDIS